MIELPTYKAPVDTVPNQPTAADVAPWNSGAQWGALQRAGDTLMNVGNDLAQEHKRAEDENYVSSAHRRFILDYDTHSDQVKQSMPRSFQGYASSMQDWLDKRAVADQDSAPSEEAKRLYRSQVVPSMSKQVLEARGLEMESRTKDLVQTFSDTAEADATIAAQGPKFINGQYRVEDYLGKLAGLRNAYEHRIMESGGVIGAAGQDKAKRAYGEALARHTAEGLRLSGQYRLMDALLTETAPEGERPGGYSRAGAEIEAAQAAGLLTEPEAKDRLAVASKSDTPRGRAVQQALVKSLGVDANRLFEGMSPADRARYIQAAQQGLKQEAYEKMDGFARFYGDETARLMEEGGGVNPQLVGQINSMAARGVISPDKKSEMIDRLDVSAKAGGAIEQMKLAPASQIDKLMEDAATAPPDSLPGGNFRLRDQASAKVAAEATRILRRRAEDPMQYTYDEVPEIEEAKRQGFGNPLLTQKAVGKAMAVQAQIGVPEQNRRATSKSEAIGIVAAINAAPDEKMKNKLLQDTVAMYGRYGSQMVSEAIEAGLPETYRVATYARNPIDQERLVASAAWGDEQEKAFKASAAPGSEKLLKDSVSSLMGKFRASMFELNASGRNTRIINELQTSVLSMAKSNKLAGMPEGTAAEMAYKTAIENTFHINDAGVTVAKVGDRGATQNLDAFDTQLKRVKDSKEAVFALINTGEIAIPKSPVWDHQSDEMRRNQFAATIKSAGSWVTLPTMDGAALRINLPGIGKVYVRNQKGDPFTITTKQASIDPAPEWMTASRPTDWRGIASRAASSYGGNWR